MSYWNYSETRKPPMPVMKITITTIDERSSYPTRLGEEKEIEVDTGYDGSILVPDYVYYDILNLNRFELPERGKLETPFGETEELYIARAFIAIPLVNVKVEILVETFIGCKEMLAGRELLNKYILTLNGPGKKLYAESFNSHLQK
jgi:predicted aspartyl protease